MRSRSEEEALLEGSLPSCARGAPRSRESTVEADLLAALAIAAAELLDADDWSVVERSIGTVFRGLREHRVHRQAMLHEVRLADVPTSLTAHQTRVLALVAEGKTYKEIGAMLGRSWRTVNNTVEKLRVKFEVASRGELVAEAMRRGLIAVRNDRGRSASA